MELNNEFTVAVPVERAWALLTDLERIAPCLPGAQLREVEGEEYRGAVKVKVGPITATYDGAVRFVERDEVARRFVMRAEGRESRGQGNASATITVDFAPRGESSLVTVVTDLAVTGKVAQFGRGVMAEVSAKLLDQFVSNLEKTVLSDDDGSPDGSTGEPVAPAPAEGATVYGAEASTEGDGAPGVRYINSGPVEPVDLLEVTGGTFARRLLKPIVVAGAALGLVAIVRRRRR